MVCVMAIQLRIPKPSEKQRIFLEDRHSYVAYGGARGGGKSWAVRKKAAGLALSYPGAGILIVRRTFPELRENHILPMTADLAGIARYRETEMNMNCWKIQQYTPAAARTPAAVWKSTWARMP